MHFETFQIEHGQTVATIVPGRGALIAQLRLRDQEVFYLDRTTLEDPSQNVRGGIPVLFPFAGKLTDDRFVLAGTTIGRHGFARAKPWSVSERSAHAMRLTLKADADTRSVYPFDFMVEQTVFVLPRGLQVELLVCNGGPDPLPLSPGWHPYFACRAEGKDRVTGNLSELGSQLLSNDREFDFGLPAPRDGRTAFVIPDLGRILLSFSPEMRHLQFWSQPGKDFICVEPFFGPENTINTDRCAVVRPAECRMYWMRVEVDT